MKDTAAQIEKITSSIKNNNVDISIATDSM